jgi:hypothetical protein
MLPLQARYTFLHLALYRDHHLDPYNGHEAKCFCSFKISSLSLACFYEEDDGLVK